MRDSPLKAIVFASLKFARRRTDRQLASHFGLASGERHVLDEFPSDLAKSDRHVACDERPHRRQREIVEAQIREFTSNPTYRELIDRVLFQGELVTHAAEKLRLNPSTARGVMMKVQQYLGLSS